jgi:hypothetical protein
LHCSRPPTIRCGAGRVRFFSPPDADETGFLGGAKYCVQIDDRKYGGAALFTCGQPGGWLRLRGVFIDSFRDNPGSTFPGGCFGKRHAVAHSAWPQPINGNLSYNARLHFSSVYLRR